MDHDGWGGGIWAERVGVYRCTLTVYPYSVNIYSTLNDSMGASVLISLDYVCKNCTAQGFEWSKIAQNPRP